MSYIPSKAMHHAHTETEPTVETENQTGGGELGGVPDKAVVRSQALGWLLGAAGAGVVAVTVAGLLSLRSSSRKPAPKRRAPRAKTATRTPTKRTAKKDAA